MERPNPPQHQYKMSATTAALVGLACAGATLFLAAVVASAGGAEPAKGPFASNTFEQPNVVTNGLAALPGEAEEMKLVSDDPQPLSSATSWLQGLTNSTFGEQPRETDTNAAQPFAAAAPAAVKRPALRASNFGFNNAMPIPNGVTQVNLTDKGFNFRVARSRVGLHELRLSFTNGVVKRTSLLFVGRTSLRAPLSVEGVEVCGVLLIFAFVSVAGLLWIVLSRKHFESAAPPIGGQSADLDGSAVPDRPP